MRQAGDTNTSEPATLHRRLGRSPGCSWRPRRRRCRRPTATTTTTSCPSARTARSPTSTWRTEARIMYVQGQSLNTLPPELRGHGSASHPSGKTVRVIWYEGASSFGGGQQGEAGEQALMLASKVGKPVRVQWMRWDQDRLGQLRPLAAVRRHDGRQRPGPDRRSRLDRLRARPAPRSTPPRSCSARPSGRRPRQPAGQPRRTPASTVRPATARSTSTSGGCWPRRSPLYGGSRQEQRSPCSERAAVLLRQRADRRRARPTR